MAVDPISAVAKCLEYVDDPSKVTIDIIMLKHFDAPVPEVNITNALDNLQAM